MTYNIEYFINPAIPSAEEQYCLKPQVQDYIALGKDFVLQDSEPTIAEIRQAYLAHCQFIAKGETFAVQRTEHTILSDAHNITIRSYLPEKPRDDAQILFLHGGGFVVGNLDSHDSICAHLAQKSQMQVWAVDYRLAPEHKFPAACDDCFAAYQYLCQHSDRPIIVCGDSAGGTLAAGLSLECRAQNLIMPQGQLLLYPYLGGDHTAGSYQRHRNAPQLTLKDMHDYARYYYGDTLPIDDPRAMPLRAPQFAGLPATVVFVAEIDPLADDGVLYVQRLKAAGVVASCTILTGLPHGFMRAWSYIDDVAICWEHMNNALEALAKKDIVL